MMIRWPRVCAGCGDFNESKITPAKHLWKHSHEESAGYNLRRIRTKTLMIEGWLCSHCKARANGIIGAWVIIWIAMFIGSIAGFSQTRLVTGMIFLFLFSVIGCPTFLHYRGSPITHFIQIQPSTLGFEADPTFHCHNSKYHAILRFVNPGLDIVANHPGKDDDKAFIEQYIAHATLRVQPFPQSEPVVPRNAAIPLFDLSRQARCPACGYVNMAPPGKPGSFVLFCEKCGAKLR